MTDKELTQEQIDEIEEKKKEAHDEAEKTDEILDRVDKLGEEENADS